VSITTLIPIFGDQLSKNLASLRNQNQKTSVILMMEVWDEATYVKHHKQKIALVLSAMRHFAAELKKDGWTIDYVELDDEHNSGSFSGEVSRAIERHNPGKIDVVRPSEWRVDQIVQEWPEKFGLSVRILTDDRYLCSLADFRDWADGRKQLTMEHFYRTMRKKTNLLVSDQGAPAGGQWNLDKFNREPLSKSDIPSSRDFFPRFKIDKITAEVIELVKKKFSGHFGSIKNFNWPTTQAQAEAAADTFLTKRLKNFGRYQDAMLFEQDQLFHSMLSTSLNLGLLNPLDLCLRAEAAYERGEAPLNSVEGFIRQIIGWREYIRGFYWYFMPTLADKNELNANRPLPNFFWTGKTDMRCMADSIRSTYENAHAHHIQRLMVLGNFALLAGIRPAEVQEWFLAVYADAYEWVEMPNVVGMALFADGGKLATKPYAASGNYINKMSDYCASCSYSVSKKTGDQACPFNYLYWNFMIRNRQRLEKNHRVNRNYWTWERMSAEKKNDYIVSAHSFLKDLEATEQS
jgi:deoxyribodipyrimidine photolyase-related protein